MSNEQLVRQILVEIDRNPAISQRQLSTQLGVSIGIINWHMKRFVKKGLVKLQQAPVRRYLYYLTPVGFAEKARLTAEYLKVSFDIFRQGRLQYEALFAICNASHWGNVMFLGDSELVELAGMAQARAESVKVRCILDPWSPRSRHGTFPIHSAVAVALQEFPNRRVDALIGTHFDLRVADRYDLEAIRDELGLEHSRVLVPAFLQ